MTAGALDPNRAGGGRGLTARLVVGELSVALAAAGAVCGSPWFAPAVVVAAAGLSLAVTGLPAGVLHGPRRDSASAWDGSSGHAPYAYDDRGRRVVGMAGDGTSLTAVVRVDAGGGTGLQPVGGTRGLPLPLLSGALEVDGIALASAHLVQQVRGGGPAGAPALRLTWVVLRLEPGLCPAAVAARGGGLGGAQRCLVRAADQLASRIVGAGLGAAVLDQEGVNAALAAASRSSSAPAASRSAGASAASCSAGASAAMAVPRQPHDGQRHVHAVYAVIGPGDRAARLLAGLPGRTATLGLTARRGALGRPAQMAAWVQVTGANEQELRSVQAELQRAGRAARVGLARMDRVGPTGMRAALPWGGGVR
ncbi:type VII secretion protein EccE [Streptomyces sp. NPDC058657]|uniref:type VII secretion protein EccE n=1 Tax=unclassified Streptomyces TaxID=2593676 RepID=UPI003656C704